MVIKTEKHQIYAYFPLERTYDNADDHDNQLNEALESISLTFRQQQETITKLMQINEKLAKRIEVLESTP